MKRSYYTAILFLLLCLPSYAQPRDSVLNRFLSINYDNDFFSATDRYFTQGIKIEFAHPALKKSPVSKLLIGFGENSLNTYSMSGEQNCFTPSSIRRDTIFTGDRPFAAVMFLSHIRNSFLPEKEQKIVSQIDLGIIGPCAVCEQEQKGLHRVLENITPLGWEFQLGNDVVINYNLKFEKGMIMKKNIEIIGLSGLRTGTLWNDISLGMLVRTGRMKNYFSEGNRIERTDHKFYIHGFLKGNVKAVAYNATLQGGLFGEDIYTMRSNEISRIVARADAGIVLAWKRLSVEYTKIFITEEFKNGKDHGWGHCNLTAYF